MKKSLYAIIVIVLSAIGANALASMLDVSVHRVTVETNDKTGNDNMNGKSCGSKIGN